ncbi:NADP-dependent oxidoreductase domain-containing protein [Ampelomyces quisqualis]|uniref:NADP-dependent oxidoreductase domain-containing protein n=1 Tax=Ampelomyces quisqualis TaxID=50730 RepID=A0A6A5QVF2_AMPQU|nr:NADP-dependent oxidoreductase domain-containing protein [Ampelomyces quisqualis]
MVKIVMGGAGFNANGKFNDKESRSQVLDILLAHDVKNIDTARLYQGSEVAIGELEKRTQFVIDTKLVGGFNPGNVSKDQVIKDAQDSLDVVGIKQFDILYIHAPDETIPFEDTLAGINQVYKKGLFRRFGLSNFSVKQLQQVHDICKSNNYVLPTAYQGNYSPVARHLETLLFPTLKNLGIAFYAYSPIAGGFLTKSAADLDAGAGRFNAQAVGGLYAKLYDSPAMRDALVRWNAIAEDEGVTKAELAYRWVAHHSALAGDGFAPGEENGVIIGASSLAQIEQTIAAIKKGELSGTAVEGIEEIWKSVESVAPVDNYHHFKKA